MSWRHEESELQKVNLDSVPLWKSVFACMHPRVRLCYTALLREARKKMNNMEVQL